MKENFEIKPEGTVIGRAVELNSIYSNFGFRILTFCLWFLGFVSIAQVFYYYFMGGQSGNFALGGSFLFTALFLFYLADRSFYFGKIKSPNTILPAGLAEEIKSGKGANLFSIFSFELAKATYPLFLGGKKPTSADLGRAILTSKEMNFILIRIGISNAQIASSIEKYAGVESSKIIPSMLENAILQNHIQIEVGDLFAALCEHDPFFAKMINSLNLELKDILHLVYWQTKVMEEIRSRKKFFSATHFRMTGGIGRDWAFGWATFLKQFSYDLSDSAIKDQIEYIGHDNEIEQIKEALMRQSGGNAVLVGEAGVGKRTTVMGFVKKVVEGKTGTELDFKHIIKIDVDNLMSGTKNPAEVTERIDGVFNEAAAAGNIIIYIENFQNLLNSGDAGKIDATEALLPVLDQGGVHILATADIASYNEFILPNGALAQRLTRVTIEEPNKEEMIRILEDTTPLIEYNSKTFISYEAIKETISAADKYILNLPNPEKSINLLDAAAAKANSERGKTIVLAKDVLDYVSEKYQIPLGEVGEKEKKKLLVLEDDLHKAVIGQNEAISAIANAMRRARAGVEDSKKPIGSFLFLGPTGVGKTETAKALARSYFGSEEKIVRFDMSEYKNEADIYRLIGSGSGSAEDKNGVLTTALREQPFSLVLFDEIEKANRNVLDLFLQILDEGFVTDGSGRKVSFRNAIIICTSNAGANLIREAIKNNSHYENIKKALLDFLQTEGVYKPEFLNRFTAVIAFSPLSPEEIVQVAGLMIEKLKTRMYADKGIAVTITPDTLALLAKAGYDPQMGARPMERVIQEKLENLLAKKILAGELKKGDTITITAQDIG